ncbi:mannose-1-phosphate guanylyltransferase / mannose-6-phosphate isomerase [Novimethylophilus kurashikiensis]|uniref:mannose-1-phosphate guanylyltransferase n=1 Tax=Novimethylophilus kurashikiensis TaxID=1825523 RepID=A0A2R5F9X5_9PROT|nr:mannose-1-phosphate guanylyltransferase/mannose-6-phosphate isomerase [Novimethylophilus kurashikiensis]GBG14997.1 mannose-1-phosphate guanylyltransferase / mannose-6-phosphate isomerase [Novimethylophilus kurashikiensis]
MNVLLPVILCGGSGTRLWPLSREKHPKQLLMLGGDNHTMLQSTALRITCDAMPDGWKLEHPLVVGQEECRFMTAEQLRQVDMTASRILLEPVGRNTAPALTLAALAAVEDGNDPVLVAMPADHVMLHPEVFCETLAQGLPLAMAGRVMTFGIVPTAPETGYGYIRCGKPINATPAQEIMSFVEKPDIETARRYVADGNYLWNSGIFMMKASTWLKQMDRFRPDILAACMMAMAQSTTDHDFTRIDKEAFVDCPSDSIDYAVMERLVSADEDAIGAVLSLDAGWSDVGAWSALWEIGDKDKEGNVLAGDVLAMDTRNSLVRAENRMVACIGMDDTVVVETADAVLVAHRDHLHLVKDAVAQLKSAGRPECDAHRKVQRPWGYYDSLDGGMRFQVKRIVVSPGACLSLQMHHHRAEHWVVVTGTARVTRGDEKFLLTENQSTYIPLGTVHRLENPGVVPLEIIEVQSGTYLGEDDIVRFEDFYGRDERLSELMSMAATTSVSSTVHH